MPREIADSDAESDFNSPQRPIASPIPENDVQQSSLLDYDPIAHLEFDQFLSPTQRISSAVERQDDGQSRSMSSTDRFLQAITQADDQLLNSTSNTIGLDGSVDGALFPMPNHKKKRTMSEIEEIRPRSGENEDLQRKSKKRAKTYGNSRSQRSDASNLFSDSIDFQIDRDQNATSKSASSHNDSTSTELPVEALLDPQALFVSGVPQDTAVVSHLTAYQQAGSTSFLQSNIQNTSILNGTASGYKGINLDFRGTGLNIDVNANPFGSLSQVSLDGDIDLSQSERFASFFRRNHELTDPAHDVLELDSATALQPSHLKEMTTSPLQKADQHESLTGFLQRTDEAEDPVTDFISIENLSSNHDRQSTKAQDLEKSGQKKRGRKPKSAHTTDSVTVSGADIFQQLQSEDPLDVPAEQYKPRPSRSRAGTVDSVNSHASQISRGADNNNKRKSKKSTNKEAVNVSNQKHVSSELNLSDPAMMGAPKEMYVPRPSKSRSRRTLEDEEEDELHRKEDVRHDKEQETPAPKQNSVNQEDQADFTSTKKKPGRKSKVKRAKTSAAALLKSAEMYDEEDKDCIILDVMPAKVKMAPLPEISRVKEERKDENETDSPTTDDTNISKDTIDKSPSEVKISIDIPKLPIPDVAETTIQNPEPKKRGRKPKKKPEVYTETEPSNDTETNTTTTKQIDNTNPDPTTLIDRPALSEKAINTASPSNPSQTSTPPPKPTSPRKPIHSPLKSSHSTSRASTPTTSSNTNTNPITHINSSNNGSSIWSKPRIGLSKRTSIPSLLRKLDRSKEPPKTLERKEKLSKRQAEEEQRRRLEAEDAGEEYVDRWEVRGRDGMLVEWDE